MPLMSFKRGQLEYFVEVAREGQMTRAAKRLHIAQPALSQAIAQLESELGLKLLERHARGVTLTPAGEAFYEKARLAVAATDDAIQTARSLARSQQGTIEFGFLGAPPGLDSPRQLREFTEAFPDIDIRYRELPFPTAPTGAWLAEVDVAVCHQPAPDPAVWSHVLRREPRMALLSRRHPLAGAAELELEEVLGEVFIGMHPAVEGRWAGFWSLDDHRGGPPERLTTDEASNPQEVLAALSVRKALTTVPSSVAAVVANVLSEIDAIPLRCAMPAQISLVGRIDRRTPLVAAMFDFARGLSEQAAAGV
jgi:DNA-binding transcriptional LysR family regulator